MLIANTPCRTHVQVLYGSIVGTVTDLKGAIVPGASVNATKQARIRFCPKPPSSDGAYTILNAQAGSYTEDRERIRLIDDRSVEI